MIKKVNGRVLIIPDIHQNLKFANVILERHSDEVDHIVFLGDYFDCIEIPDNQTYFSMDNTCLWLNETSNKLGDKATWLVGNHDLCYLATYVEDKPTIHNCHKVFLCTGFSQFKARVFNTTIDKTFIDKLELACRANQYTLSHAGFHVNHFKVNLSLDENIDYLCADWRNGLKNLEFRNNYYHWIAEVGKSRRGNSFCGSPVWLDFEHEFEDIEDLPQIVGHTNGINYRQKGKSYCIDAYRTVYAIIDVKDLIPKFYGI